MQMGTFYKKKVEMNNIAFITIHIGPNFGSNLQTIATSEVFKRLGCEATCVNYIPPRVTFSRYLQRGFSTHPRKIVAVAWLLYYLPQFLLNRHVYNSYLRRHCRVSKSIYAGDNFAEKCPKADYYVTGSDQSWNFKYNEGYDGHYFFDGIEGKKIAYATSVGTTELSDEEKESFKKHLPDYKALSVREASAQQLLNRLGFETEHLIDPTFMLNKSEWEAYMPKRLVNGKYLLVYLPYNIADKRLIYQSVRNIAAEYKLKVVTFTTSYKKERLADKTFRFANPGEFLSLMNYADYVVTNSFHGTAFSLNLNKQFWVYMPTGFSTRISSLLELCGLERRLLTDVIEGNQMEEIIDYEKVNMVLDRERNKAMDFLKRAIE